MCFLEHDGENPFVLLSQREEKIREEALFTMLITSTISVYDHHP